MIPAAWQENCNELSIILTGGIIDKLSQITYANFTAIRAVKIRRGGRAV